MSMDFYNNRLSRRL